MYFLFLKPELRLCLLSNTDNVACPKWRAFPVSFGLFTDGSVVKMAVARPRLRGDSLTRAGLLPERDQIRKYHPPVVGGAFPVSTRLTRLRGRLARISLSSNTPLTELKALPTQGHTRAQGSDTFFVCMTLAGCVLLQEVQFFQIQR